jgi:hypothetical protein
VIPIWNSLLAHLLLFFQDRRLVFVLDLTPLDDRACVVYLGLLVHSRLLPVSWQVMPLQETWEERQWAIVGTLLDRVLPHLGHLANGSSSMRADELNSLLLGSLARQVAIILLGSFADGP